MLRDKTQKRHCPLKEKHVNTMEEESGNNRSGRIRHISLFVFEKK